MTADQKVCDLLRYTVYWKPPVGAHLLHISFGKFHAVSEEYLNKSQETAWNRNKYMGVSKNSGTQKWMVYNEKPY